MGFSTRKFMISCSLHVTVFAGNRKNFLGLCDMQTIAKIALKGSFEDQAIRPKTLLIVCSQSDLTI